MESFVPRSVLFIEDLEGNEDGTAAAAAINIVGGVTGGDRNGGVQPTSWPRCADGQLELPGRDVGNNLTGSLAPPSQSQYRQRRVNVKWCRWLQRFRSLVLVYCVTSMPVFFV